LPGQVFFKGNSLGLARDFDSRANSATFAPAWCLIILGTARYECGTPASRGIDATSRTSHTGFELPFKGYSHEVTGMSTSPPPPGTPGSVGQRIDEALELIQMELRHAIGYVNDAVVPQVRRESISAMRSVADTLRSLADRMEKHAQKSDSSTDAKGPKS
jgi:hypothetical protein